jgi:hypothetical protein
VCDFVSHLGRLFHLMAAAAASARIAGIRPPAVVEGDGMLEVGFVRGPGAWWEGALVIADLDEAAEPLAWLVGADFMTVVAGVGGHHVEPHGQCAAAGQGEDPRVIPGFPCCFTCAWGELPVTGRCAGAGLGRQLVQEFFGDDDVHPGGQRAQGRVRWPGPLPPAATGARDAMADGVAVVVDDGDFPAGVGRAGGRCCEVAGEGGVEGAEQTVVAGALRSPLEGG